MSGWLGFGCGGSFVVLSSGVVCCFSFVLCFWVVVFVVWAVVDAVFFGWVVFEFFFVLVYICVVRLCLYLMSLFCGIFSIVVDRVRVVGF